MDADLDHECGMSRCNGRQGVSLDVFDSKEQASMMNPKEDYLFSFYLSTKFYKFEYREYPQSICFI
jgi:hypothetical protein